MQKKYKTPLYLALLSITFITTSSIASHIWGDSHDKDDGGVAGYHWARDTSKVVTLTIQDSTSTNQWQTIVNSALDNWNLSNDITFNFSIELSDADRSRRQCKASNGQIRVCNYSYGIAKGWVGVAGLELDTDGHIIKGYTKLNDSFFDSQIYGYDSYNWRLLVACQELGHDFGLGHQDENFSTTTTPGTCMDYTNNPDASTMPNYHDYETLGLIYDHNDTETIGGGGGCKAPQGVGCNRANNNSNNKSEWGMSRGRKGNSETFIRITPDGIRHVTHVTWANGF